MSNPFSFPSSPHSGDTARPVPSSSVAVEGDAPGASGRLPGSAPLFNEAPLTPPGLQPESALPASQPSDSLFFRPIPYMPPLGSSPGSVLSGALQGRPPDRQVPPPNRRPAPSPASAAAPVVATVSPNSSVIGGVTSSWPPGQISSREISQLRLEVQAELEQVKNDLFGAATGVSALKDRLDGLESTVAKSAKGPAPRLEDLQAWIDERIEQAVRTALARAFEVAVGGEGARAAESLRPQSSPSLAEAPVVLSSRPS